MQTTFLTCLFLVFTSQLASNHFPTRERAMLFLARVLPLSVPYLEPLEDASDSETAVRANQLVNAYYCKRAYSLVLVLHPKGSHKLPWLDMLPEDYPGRQEIVQRYLDIARSLNIYGSAGDDWTAYRLATRLWLIDLLGERWDVDKITGILNQMAVREKAWRANQ